MGSRDRYSVELTCITCGKVGTATWSEWDHTTIYSGTGRRLESVSDGFIEGPGKDEQGDAEIVCSDCGIQA